MKNNVVILLVGCPGSGKSTWGRSYADRMGIVRLCPDEFRAKLGTGEDDQTVSPQAFGMTRSAMKNALELGQSVMIDATNMYKSTRKQFLDIAHKYNIKTMAVVFEVDKEILLKRNRKRGKAGGRNVPEDIIDMMLAKYQRPDKTEFNEILYITKV